MAKKDITVTVTMADIAGELRNAQVPRFTVEPATATPEPASPRNVPRHTVSTGAPAADPEPQQPAQE